jgi:Ser/Thr protein kinase RdoA (MazF antagonist)
VTSLTDLHPALEQACAVAGLDAQDAEPVRLGENAIFRLPGGVVIRVSRPGQQAAARREVAVSRWLADSGVAAVEALREIDQPVEAGNRSVTFWRELPGHQQGNPVQVATALKNLHALPVPGNVPLGTLDPFVRLAERISSAATLPSEDRDWLAARLADLQEQWAALAPQLPACVVHGDAWAGNVVATDDGRIVLLDLERCSIGPHQWDLVSTAVKYATCGLLERADYQRFCDAYGSDVTAWSRFPLLRDIRELRMSCYISQQAADHPAFQHEAQFRVDCLRGRHGPRPWAWTPAE